MHIINYLQTHESSAVDACKLCKNIEKAWLAHCSICTTSSRAHSNIPLYGGAVLCAPSLLPMLLLNADEIVEMINHTHLTQKVLFNDDKAYQQTKKQTTTENYSKFIRWDTHKRTNEHPTADLDDDDDGTQNFAVLHKSLVVIVELLVSILNISKTIWPNINHIHRHFMQANRILMRK